MGPITRKQRAYAPAIPLGDAPRVPVASRASPAVPAPKSPPRPSGLTFLDGGGDPLAGQEGESVGASEAPLASVLHHFVSPFRKLAGAPPAHIPKAAPREDPMGVPRRRSDRYRSGASQEHRGEFGRVEGKS